MSLTKINKLSDMLKEGALLTAGSIDNFNTMTIGWGMIGTLWGKEAFICYVRPSRYTYKFVEENEYFTISFYKDEYKEAMKVLGTKSGKDQDKVGLVNFHPISINNSITFKEAFLTVLCKKIYIQDLDKNCILDDVKNRYYKDDDYHRYYVGEIIEIIE